MYYKDMLSDRKNLFEGTTPSIEPLFCLKVTCLKSLSEKNKLLHAQEMTYFIMFMNPEEDYFYVEFFL